MIQNIALTALTALVILGCAALLASCIVTIPYMELCKYHGYEEATLLFTNGRPTIYCTEHILVPVSELE